MRESGHPLPTPMTLTQGAGRALSHELGPLNGITVESGLREGCIGDRQDEQKSLCQRIVLNCGAFA